MKNPVCSILCMALLLVGLYCSGYLKKIPIIKDIPIFKNIELTDQCMRKRLTGNYQMSLFFEKSTNKDYERQLEIEYRIALNQDKCSITGSGYKYQDFKIDTISKKRSSFGKAYEPNFYPIVIIGQINNDTLSIEISKRTNTTNDQATNVTFILDQNTITLCRGKFKDNNSTGNAKLLLSLK